MMWLKLSFITQTVCEISMSEETKKKDAKSHVLFFINQTLFKVN